MKKIKLYVYPKAKKHEHDTNSRGMSDMLYNTVPLSEKGIQDYFVLTGPMEAEYFYMGQFSQDDGEILKIKPTDYPYFLGNEHKHILDIDGEGGFEASNRPAIPDWLKGSIITTNGPPKFYSEISFLFTRPTFSHLLIDLAKNKREDFTFPNNKSFGFRGFINSRERALMLYCLHKMDWPKEVSVNTKWEGLTQNGSEQQQRFISNMLNNSIALCPRGSGIDSVRLLEACYYGRVPVMISDYDYFLLGEDHYDTSFCFRICKTNMTPDYLIEQLDKIINTPHSELHKRATMAKEYFENVVRAYLADPTLYFLKWLERKNEQN